MTLKHCLGFLSLVMMAAPAAAADLPVKAPPAAYTAAYNWTGFYVGLNAGYGWGDARTTATVVGVGSFDATTHPAGFVGGGQVGYNWQGVGSPWVFGIEADIQGSDEKDTINGVGLGVPFTATQKLDWFATVRGRVGWAFNNWLPYVTGGWAFGRGSGTLAAAGVAFSAHDDLSTWVVGGGIEWGFARNWSAKVEYLFAGRDDINHSFAIPGGGTLLTSTDVTNNIVRAGVNYRF